MSEPCEAILGLHRFFGMEFTGVRPVAGMPDVATDLCLSWTETVPVPDWGVIESDHVVMTRHAWMVSPLRSSREWDTSEQGGYVVATHKRATRVTVLT